MPKSVKQKFDATIDDATIEKLRDLAEHYEKAEFSNGDPCQFMRRYKNTVDREIVAFTAASLAMGRRSQILAKIDFILSLMKDSPSSWVQGRCYREAFPESDRKFYRFFSYADVRYLFDVFAEFKQPLGEICAAEYAKGVSPEETLIRLFSKTHLIPNDTGSCCKRIALFLRWMVRDNSPVDIGLWSWYDKRKLLIPLDVHVLQQARAFKLVAPDAAATRATAVAITAVLSKIWPDDPCKGDFALFGAGVEQGE